MRMGVHAASLAASLAPADQVFVHAPADLGWDAAGALARLGARASICAGLEELEAILLQELRAGDRVVLMSNGSFGGLHRRLLQGLETRERSKTG
jgi:UDP-N-acetylmuramate: L-alanyl-gamma-D-glutamyl-meso-diaminopimelate ligase